MDALLIVDMQNGLREGDPKHDLDGVIERINRLAGRVRQRGGPVVFIQHDGRDGDSFAPGAPGWQLLASLDRRPDDRIVHKTMNDAFHGTTLAADLRAAAVDRLLIAGWATDFCVDATVRSAAVLGFAVVVVGDGHTVSARPQLDAASVIAYHHWLWRQVIAPHPVQIAAAAEL